MTTNNNKKSNNVLTNKQVAEIKKQAMNVRDSFKTACNIFLELSANDTNVKRICTYLGISAESLKNKNIKETRDNVLNRLPNFYKIEGSDTHFPCKLVKINSESGIANGYIAKKDSYINALLSLAQLLSTEKTYTCKEYKITTAEINEDTKVYDSDSVNVTIYDKEGVVMAGHESAYIAYLNRNREANNEAQKAKKAYLASAK